MVRTTVQKWVVSRTTLVSRQLPNWNSERTIAPSMPILVCEGHDRESIFFARMDSFVRITYISKPMVGSSHPIQECDGIVLLSDSISCDMVRYCTVIRGVSRGARLDVLTRGSHCQKDSRRLNHECVLFYSHHTITRCDLTSYYYRVWVMRSPQYFTPSIHHRICLPPIVWTRLLHVTFISVNIQVKETNNANDSKRGKFFPPPHSKGGVSSCIIGHTDRTNDACRESGGVKICRAFPFVFANDHSLRLSWDAASLGIYLTDVALACPSSFRRFANESEAAKIHGTLP